MRQVCVGASNLPNFPSIERPAENVKRVDASLEKRIGGGFASANVEVSSEDLPWLDTHRTVGANREAIKIEGAFGSFQRDSNMAPGICRQAKRSLNALLSVQAGGSNCKTQFAAVSPRGELEIID